MYNLNYTPTTLEVRSWREIISGGMRTKRVEYHCIREISDWSIPAVFTGLLQFSNMLQILLWWMWICKKKSGYIQIIINSCPFQNKPFRKHMHSTIITFQSCSDTSFSEMGLSQTSWYLLLYITNKFPVDLECKNASANEIQQHLLW
jgi:hypothetical protein